jgi:hypothetical protein
VLDVFRLKTAPLALHVIEIPIPKADEIFLSELPVEGRLKPLFASGAPKSGSRSPYETRKGVGAGLHARRVRWGASVLPASRSAHNCSAGERRFTPRPDRVTTVTIEINSEG